VQKCLSIATAVSNGCGIVVSLRIRKILGSLPCERQSMTSYHRINAGPCIIEW
jgi:hypothetical protein